MLQGYGSEVSESLIKAEVAAYLEYLDNSPKLIPLLDNYDLEPTENELNSDEWLSANNHPGCVNGQCKLTQEELNILF